MTQIERLYASNPSDAVFIADYVSDLMKIPIYYFNLY